VAEGEAWHQDAPILAHLHHGVDAETGRVGASALTINEVGDGAQVGPLLDQVDGPLVSFTGDGAYDQEDISAAARHSEAAIIVPPRATAVPSEARFKGSEACYNSYPLPRLLA
jgi:hypothetical protein